MNNVIYEQIYDLDKTGISIRYYTQRGEYTPPHWHSALELHYALNGTGEIFFGKKRHALVSGEFLLVDSNVIHHTQCARVSMGVSIYVSREKRCHGSGRLPPGMLQGDAGTGKTGQLSENLRDDERDAADVHSAAGGIQNAL